MAAVIGHAVLYRQRLAHQDLSYGRNQSCDAKILIDGSLEGLMDHLHKALESLSLGRLCLSSSKFVMVFRSVCQTEK